MALTIDDHDLADEHEVPARPPAPVRAVTSPALRRVVGQALGLGLGLALYMAVRALTAGSSNVAVQNASRLLRFEDALGIDVEASLQKAVLGSSWLVTAANWFYSFAYWPMIIGTLVFLWVRHRDAFIRYRNALFFSGMLGLVVFAAFPVAPPRFLDGYVDTVNAAARHNFIAHPSWIINENAALPSFHVGWVVLSAVLLVPLTRRWTVRILLLLPGVLMAATVVITANHYLVDIVAGIAISLAGLELARWRDRRRRRDDDPAPSPDDVAPARAGSAASS